MTKRCNSNNLLIFKLAQHVSTNSLPILRSARLWFTACGIMSSDRCRSVASNILHTEHTDLAADRQLSEDIIPHAVNHSLALLRMGKELPETCWANLKINKFLLLHLFGHLLYLWQYTVSYFRFPPRCFWGLCSSGVSDSRVEASQFYLLKKDLFISHLSPVNLIKSLLLCEGLVWIVCLLVRKV